MVHIDSKLCLGCGLCAADCISLNIEVTEGKTSVKKDCFFAGIVLQSALWRQYQYRNMI